MNQPEPPPEPGASAVSAWRRMAEAWSSGSFRGNEVDRDPRLKIICGALLFYCHMTFSEWREHAVSLSTLGNEVFNYAPSPLLENFRWLVFMDQFQTQTWLYAQGMLALLGLFALFLPRSGMVALGLLGWLFINKLYFYLADVRLFANFHHFHLFYTAILLVATDKLRAVRVALAVSYFLSGIVKLSPSWLFGEYFNALPDKLPLLPKVDWLVTTVSLGVIVLEFLGPLAWFTRVRWLRRLSFGAFVVFHLYSGVIVGFWYTTLMLPVVGAAFLGFDEPLHLGAWSGKRQLATLATLVLALVGGCWHWLIPGDARLTGEGRYLGLFMFDALHSVQFQATVKRGNQEWIFRVFRDWRQGEPGAGGDTGIRCAHYRDDIMVGAFTVTSPIRDGTEVIFNPDYFTSARMRVSGDPYLYYFYARELVRRCRPEEVSVRLDARLDGYAELVTLFDLPDFATAAPRYAWLRHNDWIRLPGTNSPAAYRWP